jgi:hypothetical protein
LASIGDERLVREASRYEHGDVCVHDRRAKQELVRSERLATVKRSLKVVERQPAAINKKDQLVAPTATAFRELRALVRRPLQKFHKLPDIAQKCLERARRPAADFHCRWIAASRRVQVNRLEPAEKSNEPWIRGRGEPAAFERADRWVVTAISPGRRGSPVLPQCQVRGDGCVLLNIDPPSIAADAFLRCGHEIGSRDRHGDGVVTVRGRLGSPCLIVISHGEVCVRQGHDDRFDRSTCDRLPFVVDDFALN